MAVGSALLRVKKSIRVRVLLREATALRAGESEIRGVLGIALNANGSAIFDIDEDSAIGVTKSANRGMRFGGHPAILS